MTKAVSNRDTCLINAVLLLCRLYTKFCVAWLNLPPPILLGSTYFISMDREFLHFLVHNAPLKMKKFFMNIFYKVLVLVSRFCRSGWRCPGSESDPQDKTGFGSGSNPRKQTRSGSELIST